MSLRGFSWFLRSSVAGIALLPGMEAAELADRKKRAHEWIMANQQTAKDLAHRVQKGVDALPKGL